MTIFQTLLFAPANHQRRVEKALTLPVDAVIIDLEDACAIEEKVGARQDVLRFLRFSRQPKAYVRVNAISTPFFFQDISTILCSRLNGIVLPKVDTVEDLIKAEWLITELEREKGLSIGSIDLIPIIETAKGVSNLKEILKHKGRVKRISFGAGDFTNDTGMAWTKSGEELLPIRCQIVIESRAADLEPPIDTVFVDLSDDVSLEKEAKVARSLGFQGKLLIHPNQIEIVRNTFSPSEEEIRQAQLIVDAFHEAEKMGSAAIRVGSQFVDYPIVYRAQKTLEFARKSRVSGAPNASQ